MQARDNEILNQEEVDTVGNNEEQCGYTARRAKKTKQNPPEHEDFIIWEMGKEGSESLNIWSLNTWENSFIVAEPWRLEIGDGFNLLTCCIGGADRPCPLPPA